MAKPRRHLSVVPPVEGVSAPRPLAIGPDEAARMVGLGHSLFWQLLKRGDIPSIKVNNRRLILVSDLERWLLKLRDQQAG